ncbi:DUF6124 family protein [Pseudomonas sp. LF135]
MAHPFQPALWQLCTGGFGLPGFYDRSTTPHTPPDLIFTVRPGLSTEVALTTASEMLESATVCAHDCAEHLEGTGRKQVLAVVQMIEIAQLSVDQVLDRECPAA